MVEALYKLPGRQAPRVSRPPEIAAAHGEPAGEPRWTSHEIPRAAEDGGLPGWSHFPSIQPGGDWRRPARPGVASPDTATEPERANSSFPNRADFGSDRQFIAGFVLNIFRRLPSI